MKKIFIIFTITFILCSLLGCVSPNSQNGLIIPNNSESIESTYLDSESDPESVETKLDISEDYSESVELNYNNTENNVDINESPTQESNNPVKKNLVYETYLSGVTNDGILKATPEYTASKNCANSEGEKPNKEIVFEGQTYVGEYKDETNGAFDSFISVRYSGDVFGYDSNDFRMFSVRSDTQELNYISFLTNGFYIKETYKNDLPNAEEHAVDFATELAQKYIKDFENYTLTVEGPKSEDRNINGATKTISYYRVQFTRKICGFDSSDYLYVDVSTKGNLVALKIGDLHVFENLNVELDAEEINKNISEKVKVLYEEKSEFTITNKTIVYQKLIVAAKDGQLCLESEYKLYGINGNGEECRTGVRLLTKILEE